MHHAMMPHKLQLLQELSGHPVDAERDVVQHGVVVRRVQYTLGSQYAAYGPLQCQVFDMRPVVHGRSHGQPH